MRNFIKPGKMVTCVAPSGGVVSGKLYFFGKIFGIAAVTAAEGESFELETGGVYELPKTAAQAWTLGAEIYAAADGIATTSTASTTKIGVAAAAAGNPSGSGWVRLNDNF